MSTSVTVNNNINTVTIDNNYGKADISTVTIPPTAPLDFGTLEKLFVNMTPQSSPPSDPSEDDVYLDDGTNTSTGVEGFRRYDGASWVDLLGDYSDEDAMDAINTLLTEGNYISLTYNDAADTLTVTVVPDNIPIDGGSY